MKMCSKTILFLILSIIVAFCEASDGLNHLESRGKKKKKHIGMYIYFADLVIKKVFILKLIYAFVLWCVIHKAGYFLAWFVGYLKEQKHDHHDHGHHHHDYHDHSYINYGPYRKSYKLNRLKS